MNTSAAAIQAHVTPATIRTWCRKGVIAAIKQAGRWIIKAASLAHRITLGRKPVDFEHRVDDSTTIQIKPITNPAIATGFTASEYVNGHRIRTLADGDTAQEALDKALNLLAALAEDETALTELTEAGIYADLTADPRAGIHRQMQEALGSPATPGECHTCGLNSATCDCR